jgi:hypothetical protein
MSFDGATYDPAKDKERLTSQLQRVAAIMSDGQWRTLQQITEVIDGSSEAGISARIRDLRKPKFGGYLVEKKRIEEDKGTWAYRLLLEPGVQNAAPQRLTNSDMTSALATLRGLYGKIPKNQRYAIMKLGRWLAANMSNPKSNQ